MVAGSANLLSKVRGSFLIHRAQAADPQKTETCIAALKCTIRTITKQHWLTLLLGLDDGAPLDRTHQTPDV
jgi:hypothetical protein